MNEKKKNPRNSQQTSLKSHHLSGKISFLVNGRDTYTHSSLCAPHWSSRGAIFWQLIHGCAKKSSRHEHGSTAQQFFPSHKACVSRENYVCVCFHMCVWRLGWLTATSFAYSRPLPLALFSLSLSLTAGTGNPQQREQY